MPSGGKRPGAGRPKKEGELRERCTLRATKEEWQLILRFAKIIKYGNKDAAKTFLDENE